MEEGGGKDKLAVILWLFYFCFLFSFLSFLCLSFLSVLGEGDGRKGVSDCRSGMEGVLRRSVMDLEFQKKEE